MNYEEFKARVAMYLQMHGKSANTAKALIIWHNERIYWAYNHARSGRDVAAALLHKRGIK